RQRADVRRWREWRQVTIAASAVGPQREHYPLRPHRLAGGEHRVPWTPTLDQTKPRPDAPAGMRETVTPEALNVEGEQGWETDEQHRESPGVLAGGGRGEGEPAAVHGRVQAEDRP